MRAALTPVEWIRAGSCDGDIRLGCHIALTQLITFGSFPCLVVTAVLALPRGVQKQNLCAIPDHMVEVPVTTGQVAKGAKTPKDKPV